MSKTTLYWFTGEAGVVTAFILYLLFVEKHSIFSVWNEWGIPLLIFIIVFSGYPIIRTLISKGM